MTTDEVRLSLAMPLEASLPGARAGSVVWVLSQLGHGSSQDLQLSSGGIQQDPAGPTQSEREPRLSAWADLCPSEGAGITPDVMNTLRRKREGSNL